MTQQPTHGCVSPAVTLRIALIAFAAPCLPRRDPGVVARFCSSVEIQLTLSPSRRADGNLQRQGGLRLLLLVSLPREVQRIMRMRESPPSWPNAPPCLWLRWCVRPSLPLMTHWPTLLLPPVLAQGLSTSLGEIRTIVMVPPFSLCAVLHAKRRVWSWGTVVQTSPPITHRSRQPTMR